MQIRSIRWGAAIVGAIIAEVALIASSFGWVAIYSYLINPNQPLAVYQQHAIASGPWVSISMGIPIFYAAGRWIAKSVPTALALWGILIVVDALILALSASAELPIGLVAASYLTKALASYAGGVHASARKTAQAA